MPLILHIETAVEGASLCLSQNQTLLASAQNPDQKDSAAWLHTAMHSLMKEAGKSWNELSAVAVSNGPGSYTGLRVGLSSAKGICYAHQIPLIALGTLQVMAAAAGKRAGWLCPMIDARRMEVFTAVYDENGEEVMPVSNIILSPDSFQEYLSRHKIYFFGNGSEKFSRMLRHPHAEFIAVKFTAEDMVALSLERYQAGKFENVAYCEPLYGKAFHSTQKNL